MEIESKRLKPGKGTFVYGYLPGNYRFKKQYKANLFKAAGTHEITNIRFASSKKVRNINGYTMQNGKSTYEFKRPKGYTVKELKMIDRTPRSGSIMRVVGSENSQYDDVQPYGPRPTTVIPPSLPSSKIDGGVAADFAERRAPLLPIAEIPVKEESSGIEFVDTGIIATPFGGNTGVETSASTVGSGRPMNTQDSAVQTPPEVVDQILQTDVLPLVKEDGMEWSANVEDVAPIASTSMLPGGDLLVTNYYNQQTVIPQEHNMILYQTINQFPAPQDVAAYMQWIMEILQVLASQLHVPVQHFITNNYVSYIDHTQRNLIQNIVNDPETFQVQMSERRSAIRRSRNRPSRNSPYQKVVQTPKQAKLVEEKPQPKLIEAGPSQLEKVEPSRKQRATSPAPEEPEPKRQAMEEEIRKGPFKKQKRGKKAEK